ncbi:MAG: PAS domain-containing protein [Verrucomicrobiota bacterium]
MNIARLKDGGYVEVNDAFVRWLGVKRSDLLGRRWSDFMSFDDPEEGKAF